jgi:hypothetical protein
VLDYLEWHHRPGGSRLHQATSSYRADGGECPSHALCQLCPAGLSVLFEHAIDLGWLDHNPAKSVRKLKTPAERRAPHRPWTDEAIATFRARATPTARLIFELGIGSVQRPGDWPKFRWSDYDGEALRITQGKTGVSLWLPCTQELKRTLDATPRTGITILADDAGRPFSYFKTARIMREERTRLGLLDHDLHALELPRRAGAGPCRMHR